MPNICSGDVGSIVSGRSCGPSSYISDRPIAYSLSLFSADHILKKNWLRKLRTIDLPVSFMVLNFDYGFQLSIIGLQVYGLKCGLFPVTFYPSVVTLRGWG